MVRLSDLRRRFPVEDAAAYAAAYEEAVEAGRIGGRLHRLRTAGGLSPAALAARVGLTEDEVVEAEEGGAGATAELLARVVRALAAPGPAGGP